MAKDIEALLAQYRPLLHQMAKRFPLDREDQEDLISQTVLTVLKRWPQYDPKRGAFGTWLGKVMVNEFCNVRRRKDKEPERITGEMGDLALELAPAPAADYFADEVLDGFELEPKLRSAFELVKLHGLSSAEAARQLGMCASTIRTYVWRARQELQRQMAERAA